LIREQHGKEIAAAVLLSHPAIFSAYFFNRRIKDFQAEALWAAHTCKHILEVWPEAFGKTTLLAKDLPIYEACRNPNIRIVICVKTDKPTAEDISGAVKRTLITNKRLIEWFGPFKSDLWKMLEFNFAKRQIDSEHPTMRFIGAKPSTVGTGCDLFIGDDLVHDENSKTPERRASLESWFLTTAESMPRPMWDRNLDTGWLEVPEFAPNGQVFLWPRDPETGRPEEYERLVLDGTIYQVEDLLARRAGDVEQLPQGVVIDDAYRLAHDIDLAEVAGWKVLYFDCWRDAAETQPLWAEHRDVEWLAAELERRDYVAFNKRLRNRAINEQDQVFKAAYIRGGAYDGVHYPGVRDAQLTVGQYTKTQILVCVCDPSSGRRSRRSSKSAYLVLAAEKTALTEGQDPECNVIDAFQFQGGFDDVLDRLIGEGDVEDMGDRPNFWRRYRYHIGVIEINDKQVYFLNCNRTIEWNRKYGGRLRGWETYANKQDPDVGIRSLDAPIKNGLIHVANATPSDEGTMKQLLDQLIKYPEGRTDFVMCLWIGYQTLREYLDSGASWYEDDYLEGPYLLNPLYDGLDDEPTTPPGRRPMSKKVSFAVRLPPIVVRRKGR
jgi:hypothetical protein